MIHLAYISLIICFVIFVYFLNFNSKLIKIDNLIVKTNGYNLDKKKVEETIDTVVALFIGAGYTDAPYALDKPIYVKFEPFYIKDRDGNILLGLSNRKSNNIYVSFFDKKLNKPNPDLTINNTLFVRELSHIILYRIRPEMSKEDHLKVFKKLRF